MNIEEKKTQHLYRYYKQNRTTGHIDGLEVRYDENVEKAIFFKVFSDYVKFLMKKVFEGFDVQLGNRYTLGVIGIRGSKIKTIFNEEGRPINLKPDFKATKKLWEERPDLKEKKQLVYHLNEHSEGIRYSFKWFKRKSIIPQKFLWYYSIAFSRRNKRTLPIMINKGVEYLVTTD